MVSREAAATNVAASSSHKHKQSRTQEVTNMPLNNDSAKVLDTVKKSGKPCKFVLVSKAGAVVGVVAYRKGGEDGKIKEAKEAGGGTVSCGIVDGKGAALSFKLLRADGYQSPPVKNSALKDYLNEGTKLTLKPTIDIVDVLPAVEAEGSESEGEGSPKDVTFRTGDQWKAVLGGIQSATDRQTKAALYQQAVNEVVAELKLAKQQLTENPQSDAAKEAVSTTTKVGEILKKLQPSLQVPPTFQPQQYHPQQMPPLPRTPVQQPPQQQRPQRPGTDAPRQTPEQQKAAADKLALTNAAKSKVKAIGDTLKPIYVTADRTKILTECETDDTSDFGKVLANFDLGGFTTYDQVLVGYANAKTLATKYVKDHGDPLVGKLPTRVQKRKQHCQDIIKAVDAQLETMRLQNVAAVDLCKTYQGLVNKQTPVPHEVMPELQNLMKVRLLSGETKQKVQETIAAIKADNRRRANEALQQFPNPTDTQKAGILLQNGCFKGTGGGTSGVKLLTENNGSIAFAYKPVDEESQMGLDFLGLEKGASGMREAVSSMLCQEIFAQTNLDLGFPKSDIVGLDGKSGALIEGIKGKMADPEELSQKNNEIRRSKPGTPEYQKLEAERDEMIRNLQTLPTQVTAESMQDVVLSSMLTCQWDCKWGNMIVDGDRARPIDGGTAIPTPEVVKNFCDTTSLAGARAPFLSGLTKYPEIEGAPNPNKGQTLPQALQPMDPQKVAAIQKIDVDKLVREAKAKRDKLVRDNPELKAEMMDDSCFDIMKESINSVKSILKSQPQITLEQFALEYEKWFLAWGANYAQSL
jgi:hypothetical protein